MAGVTLRRVDAETYDAVVALRVTDEQLGWIATNERSLAQTAADPALTGYAVFDAAERGMATPATGPVGFALLEVRAGVGFINRLMIDRGAQRLGDGRALLTELIRRLTLDPDVETITVSHRASNAPMAALLADGGFVPWAVPWPDPDPDESYLRLPD